MPVRTLPAGSQGLVLMVVGIGLLSVMDAVVKFLLESGVPLMELLFVRSVLVCGGLFLAFRLRGQGARLAIVDRRGQAIRAGIGVLAPVLFFSGLAQLPLTDATVIAFGSTFSTVALSAWWLRERIGPWRWASVAVGYVGVIVAIAPDRAESSLAHLYVVLSGVAISAFYISGKRLARTETSESLVFAYNLALGAAALLWVPFVWTTPTLPEAASLLAFALLAVAGQWCLTQAYALADASSLAPIEYTSLIWVVVIDIVVWQLVPDGRVVAGATIIIVACLSVAWREHRLERREP